MKKKIVVAGCRDYNNYNEASEYINECIGDIKDGYTLIFISGGCKGADLLGERYAAENGHKVERYAAEWNRYGKAAGPKRNEEMAKIADCVICFWDGKSKGTESMIKLAEKYNKMLFIKEIKK